LISFEASDFVRLTFAPKLFSWVIFVSHSFSDIALAFTRCLSCSSVIVPPNNFPIFYRTVPVVILNIVITFKVILSGEFFWWWLGVKIDFDH